MPLQLSDTLAFALRGVSWLLQLCASALLCFLASGSHPVVAHPAPAPHRFVVAHGRFELDGKPFQIISGDMDYVRTPRAYWRDRLRMAHAIGINTVMTYVFWNFHEAQPGQYDFTDQRDVAEFIREAQQEGLYVILRPGPVQLRRMGPGRLSGMALARSQV